MSDCPRFGKWFKGCRFEPRFDIIPVDPTKFKHVSGDITPLMKALQTRKYVADVCVNCGRQAKGDDPA